MCKAKIGGHTEENDLFDKTLANIISHYSCYTRSYTTWLLHLLTFPTYSRTDSHDHFPANKETLIPLDDYFTDPRLLISHHLLLSLVQSRTIVIIILNLIIYQTIYTFVHKGLSPTTLYPTAYFNASIYAHTHILDYLMY